VTAVAQSLAQKQPGWPGFNFIRQIAEPIVDNLGIPFGLNFWMRCKADWASDIWQRLDELAVAIQRVGLLDEIVDATYCSSAL
jgi:hypothetical protein